VREGLPPPHGGVLVNRILSDKEREKALNSVSQLTKLAVDSSILKDIENIASGLFSPLEGFLNRDDYLSVLQDRRLSKGQVWTIPVVLDVAKSSLANMKEGEDIVITDIGLRPVAILHIEDIFSLDRNVHATSVYGTADTSHPGVARTHEMQDFLLGGKISLLNSTVSNSPYYIPPKETRARFMERGWKTVVGFQTRNVPHSGHEGLQKAALNFFDGLFINPVIGRKKKGDFKDEVILETYQVLINNYYPLHKVIFGILPMEMRYAGPREAIHHAIVRKNFGCTHFIVGRDHAGVGKFYPPFAAQEVFQEFPDLGIEAVLFPSFFYCKRCVSIANINTCPHNQSDHLEFSGTLMRRLIEEGESPPKELIRPEVASVIREWDGPFI